MCSCQERKKTKNEENETDINRRKVSMGPSS